MWSIVGHAILLGMFLLLAREAYSIWSPSAKKSARLKAIEVEKLVRESLLEHSHHPDEVRPVFAEEVFNNLKQPPYGISLEKVRDVLRDLRGKGEAQNPKGEGGIWLWETPPGKRRHRYLPGEEH